MTLRAWMMDIAREQAPRADWLDEVLERSLAAGYNAVGFYLEHRYAYPSAPWAAGAGCLTPETVARLRDKYRPRGLRLIPLLNTLGHMEGFLRARGGEHLSEGPARVTAQMCPSNPHSAALARMLIADAIDAFDDERVHLGGDETRQLGQCPRCARRAEQIGKAGLYAEYYADLCRWVLDRGRRPCLWGDMLLSLPDALDAIPRETLIFDWQYLGGPAETSRIIRAHGFEVVCCPSIQSYHAPWCRLDSTQQVIDAHLAEAPQVGAVGIMITTWECFGLSDYFSIMPLVYAAGRHMRDGESWDVALRREGGERYAAAAELLGRDLLAAAPYLARGGPLRLRNAFACLGDPFELWRQWRGELREVGADKLRQCCARAAELVDADSPLAYPLLVVEVAEGWTSTVERACEVYGRDGPSAAVAVLETARPLLSRLHAAATQTAQRGGSQADPQRVERMLARLDEVLARLGVLDDGRAYRPGVETLIHPAYLPADQAGWQTGRPASETEPPT